MKTKTSITAGILCMMGAFTAHANQYGYDSKPYTIQALLGGIRYDDLLFTSENGSGDSVEVDMSTLPQLGGAWATLPKGEKLQFGMEASFLLGFKFDDVNTYSGVKNVYVDVSSYLWMFDIAGGVYANLPLGEKLRLYIGAGPLIMLGYYNSESDYVNTSHSDTSFGWGAYARTGFELQVHPGGYLGAGIRGNWCDIDFTDVGGASEISGVAAFITYTAGL
ncbi:hypothetical protein PDESU_01023 [Pontiella desulfatans]|uniref:Outer membrane protein beta-barrel domain-containing protein n=1 Tax=Pontiella desulfatans TaxID=2750659 RepID=A0A6C2TXT0_PONDE|nr:outer membrane beta-barrel protein [Pontiella desulfatans]VGO12470.1 hypothetical protein PDESU_01023 [Pontiella desulfatans]